MQALKGLVMGMAILIVAGMALLVYGMYQKAQDPDFSFFAKGAPAPTPPAAPPGKNFGSIALPVPAGSTVRAVTPAEGRLIVQVSGPDRSEHVLVLDPTGGAVLGQWIVGAPP